MGPVQAQEPWFEAVRKETTFLGREVGTISGGLEDGMGFLWFTTDKGLARYDGYEYYLFGPSAFDTASLASSLLRSIDELNDTILVIGTATGFLEFFHKRTGQVRHLDLFRPDERVQGPIHVIWDVHVDARGIIWAAAQFGLRRIDPSTMEVERYQVTPGPSPVRSWLSDPNLSWMVEDVAGDPGKLVVSMVHGLCYFDKGTGQFVSCDETIQTQRFFQDARRHVIYYANWNDGLFRYDPVTRTKYRGARYAEFEKSVNYTPIDSNVLLLYNEILGFVPLDLRDGMVEPTDDPSLNPWFPRTHSVVNNHGLVDSNRRLYMYGGTTHWVFDLPGGSRERKPALAITDIRTGDLRRLQVDTGGVFMLPKGHQALSLKYALINPVSPKEVAYAYSLDGKKWVDMGDARQIAFENLSQGAHSLRIRAVDDGSFGVIEQEVLRFRIVLPLWRQPWFLGLWGVMALLLVTWFFRQRNRQIRAMARIKDYEREVAELELKALRSQMNPHFMFNSLNSIKNHILQSEPKLAAEYLSNFAHLIRLILQNSRERVVPLEEDLEALFLYIDLERLRFGDRFSLDCSIDESIDRKRVMIPPLILQPYVENAIWHGLMKKEGAGILTIHLRKESDAILCIIEDNGIGREAAGRMRDQTTRKYRSMGLGITQDRIDIHNKMNQMGIRVTVTDLKDGLTQEALGTRVEVLIPVRANSNDTES